MAQVGTQNALPQGQRWEVHLSRVRREDGERQWQESGVNVVGVEDVRQSVFRRINRLEYPIR